MQKNHQVHTHFVQRFTLTWGGMDLYGPTRKSCLAPHMQSSLKVFLRAQTLENMGHVVILMGINKNLLFR